MLTAARLRVVLGYDPETGVFTWKVSLARRCPVGSAAGAWTADRNGKKYLRIMVDGERCMAHRLAWLYVHGEEAAEQIDHVNGDTTDNRLANLRLATNGQNKQNSQTHRNNTSGVKGVCCFKGRWRAFITADCERHHLGLFDSFDAAVKARQDAEIRLHGAFRRAA